MCSSQSDANTSLLVISRKSGFSGYSCFPFSSFLAGEGIALYDHRQSYSLFGKQRFGATLLKRELEFSSSQENRHELTRLPTGWLSSFVAFIPFHPLFAELERRRWFLLLSLVWCSLDRGTELTEGALLF